MQAVEAVFHPSGITCALGTAAADTEAEYAATEDEYAAAAVEYE